MMKKCYFRHILQELGDVCAQVLTRCWFQPPLRAFTLLFGRVQWSQSMNTSDLILFHTWIKPDMKPHTPDFLITQPKTFNYFARLSWILT